MNRKTKSVVMNCEEEFGPEWNWMPKRLVDLIPWVEKYLGLVPEEYRDSAAFETVSFRDSRRDYWLNVVRRHINWNNRQLDLKEDLAHLVQDIKRRICGIASAGLPLFSV